MNKERKKAELLLKTAKGQIEAILKMIEDNRYCIDISNQISAANSLLRKANVEILQGHLNSCLKTAIENNDQIEEKMDEIYKTLLKISK